MDEADLIVSFLNVRNINIERSEIDYAKLFDESDEKYNIWSISDEEEIGKIKRSVLKANAISILELTIEAVKSGSFNEIKKRMAYSPSGDGYGSDNHYINFMSGLSKDSEMDIEQLIEELRK